MGDAPRRYTATRRLRHLPAEAASRRAAARAAGTRAEAIELLERCLREHPALRRLGAAVRERPAGRRHAAPTRSSRELERHLPDPAPAARFMLGTALYEARRERCRRGAVQVVLERQPRSGRARVALAEALLAQRRYAEAAPRGGRAVERRSARRDRLPDRAVRAHRRGRRGRRGGARCSEPAPRGCRAAELELFAGLAAAAPRAERRRCAAGVEAVAAAAR